MVGESENVGCWARWSPLHDASARRDDGRWAPHGEGVEVRLADAAFGSAEDDVAQ